MRAFGNEAFEALLRLGCGVGPCDADGVESERVRPLRDRLLDFGRIGQKSRSA
jgi:hypothetical protein